MILESQIKNHFLVHPNPILSDRLERKFAKKGIEIRSAIHNLRKEGFPICSGAKGYWLAENPQELDATIQNLIEREAGIRIARKGLQKAKYEYFEDKKQRRLF